MIFDPQKVTTIGLIFGGWPGKVVGGRRILGGGRKLWGGRPPDETTDDY